MGDGDLRDLRQPADTARGARWCSGLSYANRRRIEIARALASRPKILLLDEPTAGMNPAETLELAEQVKSLNGLGLTVLLIEHKLDVVTTLADTVYVLDHGEVIAHGTPTEVRQNEEVLRAYLGRNAQAAARGQPDASPRVTAGAMRVTATAMRAMAGAIVSWPGLTRPSTPERSPHPTIRAPSPGAMAGSSPAMTPLPQDHRHAA